jgi:hypothetical protein
MATENLQIPDIAASQNQKEVTANAAHNLLDRAMNNNVLKTISADTSFTTTETRENFVIELGGTPGAPHNIDMPDTNNRTLAVVNNTDDVMTIRNSASGGSGQPVIAVGEASIFHYDGTDFFDLSALALSVASWLGLTDTPGAYTGESGRHPQVNDGETALEFVGTAAKRNVIAATTGAITLATEIETGDVLDGVTLAEFDRVLVKDQAAGEENGIYYVQTAAPPIRVEDFDDALDMQESPVMIPVLEGSSNAATVWLHTTTGAITVDSTALTFALLLSTGTFLSLTDVPSSFAGESGTRMTVNNAEDAIVFEGTPIKDPVVVATTASLTLATDVEAGDTIDDVVLVADDRVLIKDQGSAEDGLYTVQASGAPVRTDDLDDDKDAVLGFVVAVNEGTANAQTIWQMTNIAAVTIGATAMTFAEIGGGAGDSRIVDTVQTTDGTQTVLAAVSVASNKLVTIRGWGTGYKDDDGDSFMFEVLASVQNEGGTTTAKGSIVNTTDPDGTGWTVDWVGDDGSDEGRLRVTGTAAETVDWRFEYDIQTVGA